jgi:hypothetical protein
MKEKGFHLLQLAHSILEEGRSDSYLFVINYRGRVAVLIINYPLQVAFSMNG